MYCLGVLKLLPLQGDNLASITTQGAALGYELLPFQGVLGNFNRTGRIVFPLVVNFYSKGIKSLFKGFVFLYIWLTP